MGAFSYKTAFFGFWNFENYFFFWATIKMVLILYFSHFKYGRWIFKIFEPWLNARNFVSKSQIIQSWCKKVLLLSRIFTSEKKVFRFWTLRQFMLNNIISHSFPQKVFGAAAWSSPRKIPFSIWKQIWKVIWVQFHKSHWLNLADGFIYLVNMPVPNLISISYRPWLLFSFYQNHIFRSF